jgi:hypothetical protein
MPQKLTIGSLNFKFECLIGSEIPMWKTDLELCNVGTHVKPTKAVWGSKSISNAYFQVFSAIWSAEQIDF